jgi:hypothetical protein
MAAQAVYDRAHYREVLGEFAQKARAALPQAVNGRLESATKLTLNGDVTVQADGTVTVGSASDPTLTYTLAHGQCTCQDFQRGQAPGGWCQHRIAAALYHRVRERLASEAVPHADTNEKDVMMSAPPLPEAPSSLNIRAMIGGFEAQITLRDSDESRLLDRLQSMLKDPRITPLPKPAPRQGQWKKPYQGRS